MKRYEDLFIDFDDTLYDTRGNAQTALEELFEEKQLGQYFTDAAVFYDAYWLTSIDLWDRYAKGEVTRDFLNVERFRRPLSVGMATTPTGDYCLALNDRFLELCASKPGLVEGARLLVDYLRRKGYRMTICSNGFHEVQYKKMESCGLAGCFDNIVLSEDAGASKPSRQFFDYAFRVSGARRESTLMIGDNYSTDILGARNAGIDTVFFNRFPAYPAPGPVTYEVTSLSELMDIL